MSATTSKLKLVDADPPPRLGRPPAWPDHLVDQAADLLAAGRQWVSDGKHYPTRAGAKWKASALVDAMTTAGVAAAGSLTRRTWHEARGWRWAIGLRG